MTCWCGRLSDCDLAWRQDPRGGSYQSIAGRNESHRVPHQRCSLFVSGAISPTTSTVASGPDGARPGFRHNQASCRVCGVSSSSWNSCQPSFTVRGKYERRFDDGSAGNLLVGFSRLINPTNYGAWTVPSYSNVISGAAELFYKHGGAAAVVYLGFPFETPSPRDARIPPHMPAS